MYMYTYMKKHKFMIKLQMRLDNLDRSVAKRIDDLSQIRVIRALHQLTSRGPSPENGQVIVDPAYHSAGYRDTYEW